MEPAEHWQPRSGAGDASGIAPVNLNGRDRDSVVTTQNENIRLYANSPLSPSAERSNEHLNENPASLPTLMEKPHLQYRKRSLVLLACYLPLLIVPWVLTNVMTIRPPNLPSYYNQKGDYDSKVYSGILFWMSFIRVLNSIASISTVPVVSTLLAQGAVVYTQRRKVNQALSLRQTLTLADRGWNDIASLFKAGLGIGTSSRYLWLATGLLLLSKSKCKNCGLNST
jgi:hypothetical protein